MRRAFTSIELLTVIAIVAILTGMSVPFLRNFLIRSDLYTTAEQTTQMLRRAQILAQSGEQDGWGVYVPTGILYQGNSYASRHQEFDEYYPIPDSISVTGLQEVQFSRLYGIPSATGTIILQAINGEKMTIPVTNTALEAAEYVPSAEDAAIKFTFVRIKNSGKGEAEPTVHTITDVYPEEVWIPLSTNGNPIVDNGIVYGATGLALQRTAGFVRVMAYGALPDQGSKEVVDVRIRLNNGSILSVANDPGDNETENPFDGKENDGVGGDEITHEGGGSVLFQSRVTNAGDTVLIYWEPERKRWPWE